MLPHWTTWLIGGAASCINLVVVRLVHFAVHCYVKCVCVPELRWGLVPCHFGLKRMPLVEDAVKLLTSVAVV